MREREPGSFLYHEACSACGSSDAKAVYSNGTAYCFSCKHFFRDEDGEPSARRSKRVEGLIQGEIKALKPRGIFEETCRKFGYKIGYYKDVPVQIADYHHNGELVAQHLRTRDKEFPWLGRSKQVDLWGQHLWQTGGKRIVITEGEIDCMSIAQAFNLHWPVVSLPNGAQSAAKYVKPQVEWLESFEEIVLAFDNDEPGRQAVEEVAPLFTPGKVKVVNWNPVKDANDLLQAGKGKDIVNYIFQAKAWRPDGIVAGTEISLDDLMVQEDLFPFSLNIPKLDEKMRGLRKRELTMLAAGSGVGKSTLARIMAHTLLTSHNLKVGYIALEESVKKSALGFIALESGVALGDLFLFRDMLSKQQYEKAYVKTVGSGRLFLYDHFGSLASDNLMAKLRYMAVGLEVDFIFLDHISIVVSGIEDGDERRIIDNLMTNLRGLVENTGVGLVAITHLKVPEGTPHEEGGRVTLNQLRGSGSIKQLSDNIIGLERNQQDEEKADLVNVRLLKNRLFGDLGLCDTLKYDKKTGLMTPYEGGDTTAKSMDDDDDVSF